MLRLALEASRESAQAAQLKPQLHHSRMPASLRPAIQQQPLCALIINLLLKRYAACGIASAAVT
jgi:hypothetical protein